MKLIKLTMLAAAAAVAAMAFIGASAAPASGPWIGVCLKAELLGCKIPAKHPLKGKILALAGSGFFQAAFKIECPSGIGTSNLIESQQEKAFKGTLEELTFSECIGGCEQVKVIVPQAVEVNMETETGGWRLKTTNAKVEFFECTSGMKCKFEGTLNLEVQIDEMGSYVEPKGTSFKLIEGSALLCGSTGKWEESRTRFDWLLNDGTGTHKIITLSLIGKELKLVTALHTWIALCKTQTLLLCETGNLIKHPLLGRVLATVGPGVFKSSFESKCAKGLGETNEIKSQQNGFFIGTLEELTFSECTGGCKVVTVNTPQPVEVNMTTSLGDDWRLKSSNATVRFSGCTFGIECEFEGSLNLALQMDAEGSFADPEGTKFNRIEGSALLCGSSGKWESGRTRLSWTLDDAGSTTHKVWPTLLENLTLVS